MKRFLLILLSLVYFQFAIRQDNYKYSHILITNDDGIEDVEKLLTLAKSVKKVAKRVSIVVPSSDKSGSSNHMLFGKNQSTIEVTCEYVDQENNISIYTTPSNPADCVLLSLNGLFIDDKPDLVLSGLNGGANIGVGWFGSGTIGAVRTSAFLGVRGIALSGFDDDNKRSFQMIPNWITEFISSDLINEIGKNSYITIGFPDIPLERIKGVKIANRRVSFDKPESLLFYKAIGEKPHQPKNKTVWAAKYVAKPNDTKTLKDDTYLNDGYIIITPMSINENNEKLLSNFQKRKNEIPLFRDK